MNSISANLNIMIKASEKASKVLIRDFGEIEKLQVSKKGPTDFVTHSDLKTERIIIEELKKAKPNYSIISEENGVEYNKDKNNTWIIAPIDGTVNFLHGTPHFAISIALKLDDEIILDPFYQGRLLSHDDLEEILYRSFGDSIELIPEYLNKATTEQILTRLLRNLKNAYTQSYAYDKAMRCTNMILGMQPESPEEIRDKGILQERLLNYNEALPLLNKYLELEPEADDVDFILELIKNVREKI